MIDIEKDNIDFIRFIDKWHQTTCLELSIDTNVHLPYVHVPIDCYIWLEVRVEMHQVNRLSA
jgi:hypothetical protein